jgi:hypothetical protein
MNRKLSLLSLAALTVVMAACSPKADEPDTTQPDVAIPGHSNAFQFSSTLPSSQEAALNEAVSSLYVLHLTSTNPTSTTLKSLLKTPDVSPEGLQSWVQARVQYIVEEDYKFADHASAGETSFTYPEASEMPDGFKAMNRAKDEEAHVMMANIGAAIYVIGKKMGILINLEIPGVGIVPMKSPRTGLLQIGEGLFMAISQKKTQNIANDIFKLGILFHEARHSDGHGHTVGFLHAVCPRGVYRGMAACDYSTNGPYTVGATVMKALMTECESTGTCTARSNDILKVLFLDQASRTLDTENDGATVSTNARPGVDWDDAPEGVR